MYAQLNSEEASQRFRDYGYDGIICEAGEHAHEYAVFDESQITIVDSQVMDRTEYEANPDRYVPFVRGR